MKISSFVEREVTGAPESLHINLNKGHILGTFRAYKFIDKDTNQHVVYMPSFDISGYGETAEKASEMFRFLLDEFGVYLLSLTMKKVHQELAKFGWRQGMFSKDFSKAYVDSSGILQNLNAREDSIEALTLTAA